MPPFRADDPFRQFADAVQAMLRRQPRAVAGQTPVLTRPPGGPRAGSLQAQLNALAAEVAAAMRARMPATGTRPRRLQSPRALRSGG